MQIPINPALITYSSVRNKSHRENESLSDHENYFFRQSLSPPLASNYKLHFSYVIICYPISCNVVFPVILSLPYISCCDMV